MCDTIVALGSATEDGATLFGKNSDREPDEVQNIVIIPRKKHRPGEEVKCTYISIPQVEETARVMLCQPFWMFGAEMGANEFGVMIGNEALFTREKPDKIGLTGMDLLRLALESSQTARQALEIIIQLLVKYGQGGNCGYRNKFYYMNSFLIADASEAYVLETIKSWWAWKRIKDIWSISNIITLERDFDEASPGLIENAVRHGWCRSKEDFNFRTCYTDPLITWGASAKPRLLCSQNALTQKKGALTTADFMSILRDHGNKQEFRPDKHAGTICMHAADRLIRRSQTVGSLVGRVDKNSQFYYVTGASNPCLSPFFPIFSSGTLTPTGYLEGKAEFDDQVYWWRCEKYHRFALNRFPAALNEIQPVLKQYEHEMLNTLEIRRIAVSQALIDSYFTSVRNIIEEWGEKLRTIPVYNTGFIYSNYWKSYNRLNNMQTGNCG